MNITRDRDIPDVQKVYVNDTEVQKGQNTFVDISLFAIEDDTYVATVNRHDPVNITIMPKGAMSTVTLWGDTIETPVSKYRGGVFENVAQNESGTTNFESELTPQTERQARHTNFKSFMQVMTIQILKAFHSRALRQARLVLTQMITIQMPMVLKSSTRLSIL